jgi:hypothetical protein
MKNSYLLLLYVFAISAVMIFISAMRFNANGINEKTASLVGETVVPGMSGAKQNQTLVSPGTGEEYFYSPPLSNHSRIFSLGLKCSALIRFETSGGLTATFKNQCSRCLPVPKYFQCQHLYSWS